jgi:hypothetical protein
VRLVLSSWLVQSMVHLVHKDGSLIPTICTSKVSFVLQEEDQVQLPLVEHCLTALLSGLM